MAHALNIVRPLAETLREDAARQHAQMFAEPDWHLIDETTCSVDEYSAVTRLTEAAIRARIQRGSVRVVECPSRKHQGKVETRIKFRSLPRIVQRRIVKLRRDLDGGTADHPGGAVIREDDGRLALTKAERTVIEGLFLKRYEPGAGHILNLLVRSCIRCHSAQMTALVPGAKGRHGSWKCANTDCGLEFSYRTIVRICNGVYPEIRDEARKGTNARVNKHGIFRPQASAEFHRNERVYGDHHQLDLHLWDERDARRQLTRFWVSAWQDKATGVVAYRIGAKNNADLLSLAFRDYCLRYGLPVEVWTDNGKDYISEQFSGLCAKLGVELHHTLPSARTGESHGKSKPIERWFGTLERDLIRTLPGWLGTHPKERPEDHLWPQIKLHEMFMQRTKPESPFLSLQKFETIFRAWVDEAYHRTASATADAAPLAAFEADSTPVNVVGASGKVGARAFDVLMLRAKTRQIGRNGVSVEGRQYWSERFFGLRGLDCTVRWDPGNLGEVIVSVHVAGKADQIVIATSAAFAEWAEGDYDELRAKKKAERTHVARELDRRRKAAAGITPYHEVLEQVHERREAEAVPEKLVVNGTPVITEGHKLAAAIERAPKPVNFAPPVQMRSEFAQAEQPFVVPHQECDDEEESLFRPPWEVSDAEPTPDQD